jgi:PTH1 family peptidyl-tRNA hydrolase
MAKLIIGLGNPGLEYEATRHNVGFLVIDEYAKKNGVEITKEKFGGVYTKLNINGEDVYLGKPLTFMNLSGQFIYEISNYFKIDIKDILIIHDEKDISNAFFKLKSNGSAAGHNGVSNIISQLKTEEFNRLRIGIGTEKKIEDIKNFVLNNFSKKELEQLKSTYNTYIGIIDDFIKMDDFKKLQSKYNGK